MSFNNGFHSGVNHDRLYNASDMNEMFDGFISDGVYITCLEGFAVLPGNGLKFVVKPGKAWLKKTWTLFDKAIEYPVKPGNTYNVCLVVDKRPNVRSNSLQVLTVENGSVVSIPIEDDLYYYMIAEIVVPIGAVSVKKVYIENFIGRIYTKNSNFIPLFYSTGLLNRTMLDKWTSWENRFDVWFAAIREAVEGQTIDSIISQANDLKNKVDRLEPQVNEMVSDIQNILNRKIFYKVFRSNSDKWIVPKNIRNGSIKIIAASGGSGGGGGGGGAGGGGGGGGGSGAGVGGTTPAAAKGLGGGGGGGAGYMGADGSSGSIGSISIKRMNVHVSEGDVISFMIGSGGNGGQAGSGGNGGKGSDGGSGTEGWDENLFNALPGNSGTNGLPGEPGSSGSIGGSGGITYVYRNGTEVVNSGASSGGSPGKGGIKQENGGKGGEGGQNKTKYETTTITNDYGYPDYIHIFPGSGGKGGAGKDSGEDGKDAKYYGDAVNMMGGSVYCIGGGGGNGGSTYGRSFSNWGDGGSESTSIDHGVIINVGLGGYGGDGGHGGSGGGGGVNAFGAGDMDENIIKQFPPGKGGTPTPYSGAGSPGEYATRELLPSSDPFPAAPSYKFIAGSGGKGGDGGYGRPGSRGGAGGPGAVIIEYQLSLPWFNT